MDPWRLLVGYFHDTKTKVNPCPKRQVPLKHTRTHAVRGDRERERTIRWLHCLLQELGQCLNRHSSILEAFEDHSPLHRVSVSCKSTNFQKTTTKKVIIEAWTEKILITLALLLRSIPEPPILQHKWPIKIKTLKDIEEKKRERSLMMELKESNKNWEITV